MATTDSEATGTGRSHTLGTAEWVETRDGRRLFSMVRTAPDETDTPTVVFEAGAAADRSSWAPVQSRVARFIRAIVYDRSGLGRSPVDPADEASDVLLGRGFRTFEKISIPILIGLSRLRVLRHTFGFLLDACPADVRADMEREAFESRVFRTQRAQARTFLDEIAAWRDNPPALGDIPVTAISGGLTGDGMNAAACACACACASATASHAYRAAQSPHGRHVVAEIERLTRR